MVMVLLRIILVLLLFVYESFAYSKLKCPYPGESVLRILQKLDDFSNDMNDDPVCQKLSQDAKQIQSGMAALSSLSKSGGASNNGGGGGGSGASNSATELSVNELNMLINASGQVISNAKNITDKLVSHPQCLKQNGLSTLQLVAAVTQQVTAIGASYSGPYGVPVSFGGGVIAGILGGIDSILQKQSFNYDFGQSKHRDLFVTKLCIYHDVRKEIVETLYPDNRILTYQTLLDELNMRKYRLIADQPLCKKFNDIKDLKDIASPEIDKFMTSIKSAQKNGVDAYHECLHLAALTYNDNSPIPEMIEKIPFKETKRYQFVKSLYDFSRSEKGVSPVESCWIDDVEMLKKSNTRSNAILSKIFIEISGLYDRQLEKIIRQGEAESEGKNYVDLLEKTLQKIDWVQNEMLKMNELVGDLTFQSRKELSMYKRELDEKFFNILAPKFMKWYLKEAKKSIIVYKKIKKANTKSVIKKLGLKKIFKKSLNQEELIPLVMKKFKNDGHAHKFLYPMIEEQLTALSNVRFAERTLDDFHHYFSFAGSLSKEIAKIKDDHDMKSTEQFLNSEEVFVTQMINYLDWCHEQHYIKADGLKTMLEKIRRCRQDN